MNPIAHFLPSLPSASSSSSSTRNDLAAFVRRHLNRERDRRRRLRIHPRSFPPQTKATTTTTTNVVLSFLRFFPTDSRGCDGRRKRLLKSAEMIALHILIRPSKVDNFALLVVLHRIKGGDQGRGDQDRRFDVRRRVHQEVAVRVVAGVIRAKAQVHVDVHLGRKVTTQSEEHEQPHLNFPSVLVPDVHGLVLSIASVGVLVLGLGAAQEANACQRKWGEGKLPFPSFLFSCLFFRPSSFGRGK